MDKKSGNQRGRKESPSMQKEGKNRGQGKESGRTGGSRERGWEERPRNAQGQRQQGQKEHSGTAQGQWKQDQQGRLGKENGQWQLRNKEQPVDMRDYLNSGREKESYPGNPTSSGCLSRLFAPLKRGCFPNLVLLTLPFLAVGLVLLLSL